MTSPPLDCTHGRMTSDVACNHRLWAAQTIERRRAWHAIIALERQTRSNDVRRDMPSLPLDSTHGRTTSGVACHHRLWAAQKVGRRGVLLAIIAFGQHTRSNDVELEMPSSPLGTTNIQTMSSVTRHHRPWTACIFGRCRAWHDITALGKRTRSNDVRRGMHHRV